MVLTAKVKFDGRARGTPAGTVRFLDGSTVLGVVPLTHGKARLVTSALPLGPNPIRVQYSGSPDFDSSQSPAVIADIKALHSRAKAVDALVAQASTRSGTAAAEVRRPDGG